jgi:predicted TIM-barrel fold metal-dependent hydrolase
MASPAPTTIGARRDRPDASGLDERATLLLAMPPGACDCHVHVFAPERFPYAPRRAYTPGPASVDDLLAFESGIGISRCVVVQPSVYGADNGALLAALRRLGDRARGVAVIDPERTTDDELDALGQAGVRSVRVNLESRGERDPRKAERELQAAADRVGSRGWSIQVFAGLPLLAELKEALLRLPVPIVADHFGGARGEGGTDQPGFAALLDMLGSGMLYVKLSAPYRSSRREPGYEDMAGIARALIAAGPERALWASDWPHTGGGATGSGDRRDRNPFDIEPFRAVDVPNVLSLLSQWAGDETTWRRILVDNPARLYGFD